MRRRLAFAFALLCCAATLAAQGIGSPLERRVTVHLRDVALRDALDRVAAAGAFRLSYSSDSLALDRRVSVSRDTATVGEVLNELLRGFAVTAVVVGNDQVVLAPKPAERDTSSRPATVLDRVVVTGTVAGAAERSAPVALDVIAGRQIESRGQTTLSNVFDGSVPGLWVWEQSPSTMLARYASIRGAASFGVSFPKVYVDGIEVANPLLLTQVTPELIERVEVIRGPQGAALYGADAISGVVNIVSRHDAGSTDGGRMMVRSQGGFTSSFGSDAIGVQQHVVSTRLGSNLKSVGASVGGSTTGAFVPRAYSRELYGSGDTRLIGARSTLSGAVRLYGKDAATPISPVLTALKPQLARADSASQSLRTYTLGSTWTFLPNEIWTLAVTAGLDGYSLVDTPSNSGPLAAVLVDSALQSARGSALRGTMRVSGVARVGDPDQVGGTVTFSGEQTTLRDRTLSDMKAGMPGASDYVTTTSSNYGLTSQLDLEVHRTAYLRFGVRQEHIAVPGDRSQFRLLPTAGAALVRDFGAVTAKARFAYGRGIRSPNASRWARIGGEKDRLENVLLDPEEQSGIEAGVDLYVGTRLSLHATRFDQLASGLIQEVRLVDSTRCSSSGPGPGPNCAHAVTQFQNVGRISNAGWETQAAITAGAWTASGALATVDSRVERLAKGYSGDLLPGARMLGVPARTLTGTLAWSGRPLRVSSSVSRASDWINYDQLAIAKTIFANQATAEQLTGAALRPYWAHYNGSTRLRASAELDVRSGLTLTLTGENLLNHQTGEPDSITILPGRTITAGARARF